MVYWYMSHRTWNLQRCFLFISGDSNDHWIWPLGRGNQEHFFLFAGPSAIAWCSLPLFEWPTLLSRLKVFQIQTLASVGKPRFSSLCKLLSGWCWMLQWLVWYFRSWQMQMRVQTRWFSVTLHFWKWKMLALTCVFALQTCRFGRYRRQLCSLSQDSIFSKIPWCGGPTCHHTAPNQCKSIVCSLARPSICAYLGLGSVEIPKLVKTSARSFGWFW